MNKQKGSPRWQRRQEERKQHKQLKKALCSEDPGLAVVHPHAAGIDVGSESHFVAVPPDRDPQPVREFGSFTADLERMAIWLKQCGITTVAMQSTGVYWFALYDVLEAHGLKVFLVNARHTKTVPGRKTDVKECQWVMKLHRFGLLANSYRPPEQIRKLRSVWRLRDRNVKDASRCVQHIQKALTTMNVQLANVISDVMGVTGEAIVRAIVGGQRDPEQLAKHRNPHIKASKAAIVESLKGNWDEGALFELAQSLEEWDFYRKQMAKCDQQLQAYLSLLPTDPRSGGALEKAAGAKPGRRKRRNDNAPDFDLRSELTRIFGVDLTRIDGIDVMTVQTLLSEVGTDFSPWKTEKHFVSWLGLAPRRDISGGKLIRHALERAKNRLADVLRMAATTLLRSDSYLGARYRGLRARLDGKKAVKAMARYLACLIFRMVTRGEEYVDRGKEYYERQRAEREMAALRRKAARLGLTLVPAA